MNNDDMMINTTGSKLRPPPYRIDCGVQVMDLNWPLSSEKSSETSVRPGEVAMILAILRYRDFQRRN